VRSQGRLSGGTHTGPSAGIAVVRRHGSGGGSFDTSPETCTGAGEFGDDRRPLTLEYRPASSSGVWWCCSTRCGSLRVRWSCCPGRLCSLGLRTMSSAYDYNRCAAHWYGAAVAMWTTEIWVALSWRVWMKHTAGIGGRWARGVLRSCQLAVQERIRRAQLVTDGRSHMPDATVWLGVGEPRG
jgi:hypothetical protein